MSVDVETDCPEFVVLRLPHLHFRHPIEDLARIKVAKNSPLELQQQWRMNRIAEIEQCVWTIQTGEQFTLRHPDATHRVEIVRIARRFLEKQTVTAAESVFAQPSLEIVDVSLVGTRVVCCRQQLQPNGVAL